LEGEGAESSVGVGARAIDDDGESAGEEAEAAEAET